MTKIKLEHIDKLRKWKKSWAKIGSRGIPHHLYKYEEEKYERSLKYKYLEITTKDRENLKNIWHKVCIAKWWKNYTLIKNNIDWTSEILLNDVVIESWNTKNMKLIIKKYV